MLRRSLAGALSSYVCLTLCSGATLGAQLPTTITVPEDGDLQAAIDSAQPGDTIALMPGATFTGNFVLPVKSGGSGMITIRSAAPDAALPDADTRIDPSYAEQLPKLQSPNSSPAVSTAPGAHHYALQLLEFLPNDQGLYDIVALGDGSSAQNTMASVPHDLVVDRCYLHGDPTYGQTRGIALNSAATTIINSYIADMKADGEDSQAIGGWNGPGPYAIINNYLEAAGENVMFGGADPAIPNLIPSDIVIRHNHIAKQLVWRDEPGWTVKNLLELKNALRVAIDGNVLEYNWPADQDGYAVLFTPRNQDGTCPWCTVEQIQFTSNLVRHIASGINILGTDDLQVSGIANAITIRNNLFEDMNGATWGGDGRFLLIGQGAANIVVDHNTALQDGTSAVFAYGAPIPGFLFTNNIVPDNSWAIVGDGTAAGSDTIAIYFPGGVFLNGILAGSDPATYPAGNYYPASMSEVGFADLAGGNYRLANTSPYHHGATDGLDVGCDIDALDAAAGIQY
jgi:hypothetical protein